MNATRGHVARIRNVETDSGRTIAESYRQDLALSSAVVVCCYVRMADVARRSARLLRVFRVVTNTSGIELSLCAELKPVC